jgi:hypothetical protein
MIVLALIKKARWETSGPNGVVTEVRAIIQHDNLHRDINHIGVRSFIPTGAPPSTGVRSGHMGYGLFRRHG